MSNGKKSLIRVSNIQDLEVHQLIEMLCSNEDGENYVNQELNRREVEIVKINSDYFNKNIHPKNDGVGAINLYEEDVLKFSNGKTLKLLCLIFDNIDYSAFYKLVINDIINFKLGVFVHKCKISSVSIKNSSNIDFFSIQNSKISRVKLIKSKTELMKIWGNELSGGKIEIDYSDIVGGFDLNNSKRYNENSFVALIIKSNNIGEVAISDSKINGVFLKPIKSNIKLSIEGAQIDRFFAFSNSRFDSLNIHSTSFDVFEMTNIEPAREDGYRAIWASLVTFYNCSFKRFIFENSINTHTVSLNGCTLLNDEANFFSKGHRIANCDKLDTIKLDCTNVLDEFSLDSLNLEINNSNLKSLNVEEKSRFKKVSIENSKINDFSNFSGNEIEKVFIKGCDFNQITSFSFSTEKKINFKYHSNNISKDVIFSNIQFNHETDFSGTCLEKHSFYDCNFKDVDIQKLDVDTAEFIRCDWDVITEYSYPTIKAFGIKKINHPKFCDLQKHEVTTYLNKFSSMRKKFEIKSDYVTSEYFRYSESNANHSVNFKERMYLNTFFLYIHKKLNGFGTNYALPLTFLAISLIIFAFIYLFSGIEISGIEVNGIEVKKIINYDVDLTFHYWDLKWSDLGHSIIYTLKNALIVKVSSNFYVNASAKLYETQILTMLQKFLSAIFIGSFVFAFRRFLLKK